MKYGKFVIDEKILKVKFRCNIEKCKGACCTLKGTLGAPTNLKEIALLEKIIPFVIDYMEENKRTELFRTGLYEKYNGCYYINTLSSNDCIFTYTENGIAKCAIEKAYLEGRMNFRKPVSCELYPVRISGDNEIEMIYDVLKECKPALQEGEKFNTTIAEFVKDAIEKAYGREITNFLMNEIIKEQIKKSV